jgi:CRISPR/Cas system-associated protein Cas5 (RAMP superfamily)
MLKYIEGLQFMRFEVLKSEAIKVLLCGSWRRVIWEINVNILEKPFVSLSRVESVLAVALLRCYAALIGSFLPTFKSNVQELLIPWKWDPIGCTERSVTVKQRCAASRRAKISHSPRRKLEITHRKEIHQVRPKPWYTFKKIHALSTQKIKIAFVISYISILCSLQFICKAFVSKRIKLLVLVIRVCRKCTTSG